MLNIKDENAITLAVLVITIIILAIIAGVSISAGQYSLESTKLKNFYLKLEIVQKKIDNVVTLNEKYIDTNGEEVILKEKGEQLSEEQKNFLINTVGINDASNFKYFTEEDLKEYFDLTDIGHNLFINFENRTIVSEDPVIAKGEKHYILETNSTYYDENSNKNVGTIGGLQVEGEIYGTQRYKIKVKQPSDKIGDIRRRRHC